MGWASNARTGVLRRKKRYRHTDAEGRQQENFIRSLDVEKTRGFLEILKQKDNSKAFQQAYDNWVESINEEAAAHTANKAHYNANVLAIPAEFVTLEEAINIIRGWLGTEVLGGRYQERMEIIEEIEKENMK